MKNSFGTRSAVGGELHVTEVVVAGERIKLKQKQHNEKTVETNLQQTTNSTEKKIVKISVKVYTFFLKNKKTETTKQNKNR